MGVELYYVHDFVAVDQFDNIFSLFGLTISTPHIGSIGQSVDKFSLTWCLIITLAMPIIIIANRTLMQKCGQTLMVQQSKPL